MIAMMACRVQSWLGKLVACALEKPSTSAPEFCSFTTSTPDRHGAMHSWSQVPPKYAKAVVRL